MGKYGQSEKNLTKFYFSIIIIHRQMGGLEMDEYSILKKKQKKNGFAATSLLISIAIALLALVGAVLILGKVNSNEVNTKDENSTVAEVTTINDETCEGLNKEIVFNNNLKSIKEAAISYFTNERLPQTIGDSVKISLKEMKDKKLVLNVRDASAKTCDENNSYVEVTKEKDEYVMKVFLSCSNIEDYILVHLGCYDYCDSNVCEKKEEPVKEYEYEYKKTTSCTMTPWSDWGNWKTTREKTSNLKKEDIKTETATKTTVVTKDATKKVSYNCDKYPGYTLIDNKCVKETTTKDVKDATPSKYSYNCDKYPGYSVVGDKCVKETKVKEVVDAIQNKITYSCPSGYSLNGTKCERMVSKTDTKDGSYSCPSGYTLNGTKCSKTTSSTSTIDATPIYSTRTVQHNYTCYKNRCTTKTVFSCPSGKACGNYPQTSCEKYRTTCSNNVEESYISGYSCPSGYSLSSTQCTRTTTSTDTKNATFNCPNGYSANNGKCTRSYQEKETINATQDPITYSCKDGYTLNGKKCERIVTKTDTKNSDRVPGGYVCLSGYTLNGTKCIRTIYSKDTRESSVNTTYSCINGYTLNDKTCTKKINKDSKVTYYRYATRNCTGGSTDTRWSTSNNDSILISEGYKLTGNKKEIIVK